MQPYLILSGERKGGPRIILGGRDSWGQVGVLHGL